MIPHDQRASSSNRPHPFSQYGFIERFDTAGQGNLLKALRDLNLPAFL